MVDIYAHFGGSLAIGRRGENEARRVVFDLLAWRRHYGEGTVQLLHQRAGDESPYPCALTVEGDTAYWLIRAADVNKPGWGEAQLHYYVGDTLAKSAIWRTVTADALGDPSEPPEDPARAWFSAIQEQIGNLDELTTAAKDNLVAAINEAAKTGSGAGGVSMRVSGGYIQYSTNGGTSWDNLIATADLQGAKGPAGADGKDGDQGPQGDPGATPNLQIGTVTTLEAGEDASASISGTPEEPRLNLGIPKGAQGEAGSGGGADLSLGLASASKGQSPIIKSVDSDGKPTEWEAEALAKADGSNVPTSAIDTWRTMIAALPGIKVYGKADANGKIMAYTDAACTQEANYTVLIALRDYGNALLIYDHKTYQCVGFEEPASMQGSGSYLVAVFSRTDVQKNAEGSTVFTVETARMNIMDYLAGTVDAPITIETYTATSSRDVDIE